MLKKIEDDGIFICETVTGANVSEFLAWAREHPPDNTSLLERIESSAKAFVNAGAKEATFRVRGIAGDVLTYIEELRHNLQGKRMEDAVFDALTIGMNYMAMTVVHSAGPHARRGRKQIAGASRGGQTKGRTTPEFKREYREMHYQKVSELIAEHPAKGREWAYKVASTRLEATPYKASPKTIKNHYLSAKKLARC